MKRLARALLLVVLAAGLAPAAALAHAQLERTAPPRGAVLDRQPDRVVFTFSEPVEGTFGAVRVFDATGAEVQAGDAFHPGGRANEIAVRVRDGLADGTYTATYRVVSADSHVISGGYAYSIGAAGAAGATVAELLAGGDAGPVTGTALSVARGLQYTAIAIALGALAFLVLGWGRALPALAGARPVAGWRPAGAAFAGRLRRVVLAAAALGALSAAAAIVLQGAEAGGTSAFDALAADVVRATLSTRFGTVWGIGVIAWLALATLAARVPLSSTPRRSAALALALPAAWLVLLPGLGGHAGSSSPTAVLVPANALHVAATAVWAGGLATLLLVVPAAVRTLPRQSDRSRLLAALLARFSPLALAAVAAILVTGILQSALLLDDLASLLDTGFGRALLVKAALLAVLIGLGAHQRRRVLPALRRAAADGAARDDDALDGAARDDARDRPAPGQAAPDRAGSLRRVLRAEVALLLGVLAATAALAAASPSRSADAGPFDAARTDGPLTFRLVVDPAAAGPNAVRLTLTAPDGAPFAAVKEVTISATQPARGIGPLREVPDRVGRGRYALAALPLGAPGDWRIRVAARITDFDEHATTFEVPVR
jgi:copper transport protein